MSAAAHSSAAALAQRLAKRPPGRIAVIQTAFLGDTVFSAALVAGLAARFPAARLTIVAAPRGKDVAAAMPGVEDVLVYDKRGADRGLSGLVRASARLRERECELAVIPHRSLRSGLLAWKARVPERLGFAGAPGRLFYSAAARDPGGPFLAREGALLALLDAASGPMRLVPREEDGRAARALLGLPEGLGSAQPPPWIALALGSEWETKIWPLPQTTELAKRLLSRGLRVVLLGGPRERAMADSIVRAAPGALDTTGNRVGEALGLLAQCALCIGGDTGLVHAARALDVPSLLLFGPTDPGLHLLGPRARALSLRLPCSPCGPHGARRCPLGHHDCLRTLTVDAVEEEALALLGSGWCERDTKDRVP